MSDQSKRDWSLLNSQVVGGEVFPTADWEKIELLKKEVESLQARTERLEKALIQTFGEYLEEDYSDIPDGRAVGEFSAADLREVKAALEEGKK